MMSQWIQTHMQIHIQIHMQIHGVGCRQRADAESGRGRVFTHDGDQRNILSLTTRIPSA